MHRTTAAGFAPGNLYTEGNPSIGLAATRVGALAMNAIQEELCRTVELAGLVLSAGSNEQLYAAIQALIAAANKAVIITGAAFAVGVVAGDVVYWDSAASNFAKGKADGTAANRAVGIADVAATRVIAFGETPAIMAGLTPGTRYYLSATAAGTLTTAPEGDGIFIGYAKSATVLYVDVDRATPQTGTAAAVGARCLNNTGTPNTQFDLAADEIALRDASGNTIARLNPGSITNNIATAGPAANGRDQAGAFANDSWLHFYWIWNGATLASVSSAAAPPAGPALPAGYSGWAYAGAVRLDGAGALKKTRIRGAMAFYEARQSALAAGTATAETAVDLAALIPPNALAVQISGRLKVTADAGGPGDTTAELKVVTGSAFAELRAATSAASTDGYDTAAHLLPNVGQQIFYQHTDAGTVAARALALWVNGYAVPNGGE